jgi:hypothetical protein
MNSVADNIARVREHLRTAERRFDRSPGSVTLLAVSKGQSPNRIAAAAAAGQTRFGESYLQEALPKIAALSPLALEWHFIGPLQANKTSGIAGHFDWVHSVDRLAIARRLDAQRPAELPPLNVCLQVNSSREASKHGATAAELPELARAVATLSRLRLRGLMAIPAPAADFADQRRACAEIRELLADLRRVTGLELDTLSLGMSDDLEAAVAEGTTLVRVGTAIFGARD